MKNKNKHFIYTFIFFGLILANIFSCKKDESIIKKDPIITWANPADISSGTLLSATQLNATADIAGTFVYTPAIGTQLSAGTNQALKADFTPTDDNNYNTASKTVKINVNAKQDPVITWANPADIAYGTLLSATQLNATADVPGVFIYTPAIGTKLDVGTNQDLKVDFTPTDLVNYNTISKTVQINVTAANTPGTVTDTDGNVYNTITIGTQTWMVENLKVTHYRNGDSIDSISSNSEWSTQTTGAFCDYNNDAANGKIYGKLYNWYAVSDNRNIAPEGWHVPTDAEWTTFENNLIAYGYNYDGTTTGSLFTNNKIAKALASATGWNSDTGEGTVGNTDYPDKRNATGFAALPGGYRYIDGGCYYVGSAGDWWSATEYSDVSLGWYRSMGSSSSNVYRTGFSKSYGLSVRCVKD